MTIRKMNLYSSIIANYRTFFRKFGLNESGNFGILFAITIIPVLIAVGAAVDYSRASQVKTSLQTALDSTALHLGLLPQTTSQADLESAAAEYFEVNYQGEFGATIGTIDVIKNGPAISLTVGANLDTVMMGIVDINEMQVGAVTEVLLGGGTIEIALVLDNSGSMNGTKLTTLKAAARGLVQTLYAEMPPSSTDLSFALVPFASFVDIGESHANDTWMDVNAQSSIHSENFSQPSNRFDLYDNITNIQWEGCVEARPYPYDVEDTVPDTNNPDTLFVPAFAPDEPGYAGETSSQPYPNSYLSDSGSGSDLVEQEDIGKYSPGAFAQPAAFGTSYNYGPSFLCNQSDLEPLTNSQNTIENKLQAMFAKGGTNIVQGLVWGWRTLSPAVPFTAGRAYNDNRNQKIIILLTDGKNTYNGWNNQNSSLYSAYGYAKEGRLGTTSSSSSVLSDAMNVRTTRACTNIKETGILVYSITFDLTDPTTLQLIQNCATSPDYYYDSPSVSQLDDVFEEIATKLLKLRLSK